MGRFSKRRGSSLRFSSRPWVARPRKSSIRRLHGQATTAMLSWENQQTLQTLLEDPDQWLNQRTNLPDAILVSAGGDDVVGDQFVIYLDYGGGGLDASRYQGALDSVRVSYLDLFAFRDLFAAGVPIIGHCYDVMRFQTTSFRCAVVDGLAAAVARFRRLRLHRRRGDSEKHDRHLPRRASRAPANPAYNFTLIDTRGTVTPDASSPTGWAN